MGACPPPQPRLLRSGQRTGLYSTPDHNRVSRKKRHRILIKKRGSQKFLDDQNKKRLRIGKIHKILNVRIVRQIFGHRRPHGKHKITGHFGEQTGIFFISQIFIVQILIDTVIGGKRGQDQRGHFIRNIDRLLIRKVILR